MALDPVEAIIHESIADIRDEPAPDPVADSTPDPEPVISGEPDPVTPDQPAADVPPAGKVDHVAAAKAAAAKTTGEPPAKADDPDDFSKIPERDATGRVNRIPHTRVGKMVEVGAKKAVEEFRTKEYAPVVQKVATYEARLKDIEQVESAMFDDQPRFLQMLESIPGYSQLLATRYGGGKTADPKTAAPAGGDDPEPQPDVVDKDGTVLGYSPEGHKKLREWDRRQAQREAEKVLGARLEPFEKGREAQQAHQQQVQAANAQLEAAVKWEGFIEHNEDILKALEADRVEAVRTRTAPKLRTLLDAYMQVVPAKLKASAAAIRAQVMAEMASAPKSTAAGAGVIAKPGPVVQEGVDRVEQLIKDSIKNHPGR